MKKQSGLAAVCVMIALVAVTSANIQVEPLPPFAENIVAGTYYIGSYSIHNTAEVTIPVTLHMNLTNTTYAIVFYNETEMRAELDGIDLNCEQTDPGEFVCEEIPIPPGSETGLKVYYSTNPQLKPAIYTFSIVPIYERPEEGEPVTRRRTGGHGNPDIDDDGISNIDEMMAGTDRYNPCDPNPYNEACYARGGARPTPTPSPTPMPDVTPEATSTPEPTPVPTPTPPEKEFPWWILGVIVAGSAGLGAWLWRRRRRQNQ